jgi:hypothetical protein
MEPLGSSNRSNTLERTSSLAQMKFEGDKNMTVKKLAQEVGI